jgi:hypothetical protein
MTIDSKTDIYEEIKSFISSNICGFFFRTTANSHAFSIPCDHMRRRIIIVCMLKYFNPLRAWKKC